MKRIALVLLTIVALAALIIWLWPRLSRGEGDMRNPRSEISAAVIGGDIYVAGGIGFFRTLSSCERYDTRDREWHRCASLPRALHHVALASDGARLYASGGYVGLPFRQDQQAALFVHVPSEGSWAEIARLPHPIGQHAMFWRNERIYIVGGQNGSEDLATLWAYDFAAGDWESLPPMPTPRHSHAIAIEGDTLYVAGGRSAALGSEIDRLEAFDFATGEWSLLPPMPVGRGGHAAFVTPEQLHVIGGESLSSGTVLDRHDVLDLETLEWREGTPMAMARHGFAVAQASGEAYALGGGSRAGIQTIYSVTGTIFTIGTND